MLQSYRTLSKLLKMQIKFFTMSEEKTVVPAIYGALAAIMQETKAISKTEKNNNQNFMENPGSDDPLDQG